MIVTHDLRLDGLTGTIAAQSSLCRAASGRAVRAQGRCFPISGHARAGSASMRLPGRITRGSPLAPQHAQYEALNLAPNNSMEPTRPSECLALARY
jgi:hypothetical protein